MPVERRIPYKVRSIDLSTARTDRADFEEIIVAQARLLVLSAPAAFNIRLGSRDADPITIPAGAVGPLELCGPAAGEGIGPIYIENDVGEGIAQLLTGPVLSAFAGAAPAGVLATYYAEPDQLDDGDAAELLTDNMGRLYVRLADRLQADVDSIRIKGLPPQAGTVGVAADATVQEIEVDSEGRPNVTASGTSSAAVDWTLWGSIDGLNWFEISAAAAATEFQFNGTVGVAYLKLEIDPGGSAADMNAILSAQAG